MKKLAVPGLHAAYWGLFFLLLIFYYSIGWHTAHNSFRGFWRTILFIPPTVFICLPAVGTFYVFYTVLFSRLLQRKRLVLLVIAGVGVAIGVALVVFVVTNRLLFPWLRNGFTLDTAALILVLGFIAFVNGILALVMRGFITWYREIRLKEALRQKNAELELALIKSQLSPHFLFNTLNNIDVLIEMDAVRASGYLNKLSDLLRFMLYDTKTQQIPISEELRYIGQYIDLQKIRTSYPGFVTFLVEGETGELMVEPMLFLPFIENAFKHTGKKEDGAIRILFRLAPGRITFHCENRYISPTSASGTTNGLGNTLIRRRLGLLYPGRHELAIETDHRIYKATLILNTGAN